MSLSKYTVVLVVVVVAAVILSLTLGLYSKKGCSATYWLNPDTVCQVRDEIGDRALVEYFNSDTNDLRLYLQQDGQDVQIEHPYGKVKSFSSNLNSNQLRLDPTDPRYLIVNGERFEIVRRE
jgi:hypothetical protein